MTRLMVRLAGAAALFVGLSAPAAWAQVPETYTTFEKYGVCGSIDDSCYNPWHNRTEGEEEPWKVLIYYHVAPGVNPHANLEAGVEALTALFEDQGYEVTASNDPATFESAGNLRSMDTIVFFSTGREALTDLGKHQFMLYMRGGGGFVGIHNAFGTSYSWTWYEGLLGGQLFNHGPRQQGTVIVQSENDPSVAHIEEGTFFIEEEWYNIYPDPRQLSDINILLTVDETTMEQGQSSTHPGMGDNHPVSWCHYYDGGRAWMTVLGHSHEILEDDNFLQHVLAGVDGTMGKDDFCLQ